MHRAGVVFAVLLPALAKSWAPRQAANPLLLLASGVLSAIRAAVSAIRSQAGLPGGEAYELEAPATVLRVQAACGLEIGKLVRILDDEIQGT